jgi:hypothetical protein
MKRTQEEQLAWDKQNCRICRKGFRLDKRKSTCDLEGELSAVFFGDGVIPADVLERIGFGKCKEFESDTEKS